MGKSPQSQHRLFTVLAVIVALAILFPTRGETSAQQVDGTIVPGRYIVLTAEGVDPAAVAADYGLQTRHLYRTAVHGFAAAIPDHELEALQADKRIRRVEADRIHSLADHGTPTGVDRIETDPLLNLNDHTTGVTVDLDVAIIDTGISQHTDLNLAGGRNFAGGNPSNFNDRNGHGTHVAGTVGGKDDGSGVAGVAPGVRLWAIRVCSNFCFTSDMVAGINWMTERKLNNEIDFASANMSISSDDSNNDCSNPANSVHEAICSAVDAGIVFVLAAGNDNREKTPYPVTLSVSAVADFDGVGGGAGAATCRSDEDDTLANFSNYGSKVKIAAPGVCILSTWNDGGYNTISGTSMAAPHVTGAAALYLHQNGLAPAKDAAGVATIENALIDAAHLQGTNNHACSYDDSRVGGPMLFVNATSFGGDGTCTVAN